MSVVVEQKAFENVEDVVLEAMQRQLNPDSIKVQKDLALIATVGHGMNHHIGVAAQLFTALSTANVNVRIIDQGGSEINIIVGVDQVDFDKAIQAIYNAFEG
jgi:aspartate kinase